MSELCSIAIEYMNQWSKRDDGQGPGAHVSWCEADFYEENGRISRPSHQRICWQNRDLTNIPFGFQTVDIFSLTWCTIKDFSFLPKKSKMLSLSNIVNTRPSDYVLLLLLEAEQISVTGFGHERVQKLTKIFNEGRVNNRIPRELIPGKINELRELDGTV